MARRTAPRSCPLLVVLVSFLEVLSDLIHLGRVQVSAICLVHQFLDALLLLPGQVVGVAHVLVLSIYLARMSSALGAVLTTIVLVWVPGWLVSVTISSLTSTVLIEARITSISRSLALLATIVQIIESLVRKVSIAEDV